MAKKKTKTRRKAKPKVPTKLNRLPPLKLPRNARLTSLQCTAIDDSLLPEDQQCE
jgi:hypothetical protein